MTYLTGANYPTLSARINNLPTLYNSPSTRSINTSFNTFTYLPNHDIACIFNSSQLIYQCQTQFPRQYSTKPKEKPQVDDETTDKNESQKEDTSKQHEQRQKADDQARQQSVYQPGVVNFLGRLAQRIRFETQHDEQIKASLATLVKISGFTLQIQIFILIGESKEISRRKRETRTN